MPSVPTEKSATTVTDQPAEGGGMSVAFPAGIDELTALVGESFRTGAAIYPAGGGTAWTYGGLPGRPGTRVETSKLDRVIDYPFDDMTITVEAGMTLGRLQAILSENNQYLPIDPPAAHKATLGGIMATGWTGPRRQWNMKPRDQLIGIGFVDGQGRLIRGGGRVVKNVAGYDFPKLLSGSMGMLGVISELTFKVRPRPESTAIAWVGLNHARTLAVLLERLNLSATRPTAIEVLSGDYAGVIGKAAGVEPKPWVVAIGFDESAKAVAWQCEKIREELPERTTCEILRDTSAVPVWQSLTEGFPTAANETLPVARVVTRPGRLASFLDGLDESMWSVQAHGGQGIAMIRPREAISRETALEFAGQWQILVERWGGSVTWPVCPEGWKVTGFPVWGKPRPEWAYMAGVKRALDPRGILNPGRFPVMD